MKKTLVFMTVCMLVNLSAGAAPRARVHRAGFAPLLFAALSYTAAPQATDQQPKKGWKSTDEYNAFNAAATEKDPNKKISLAEAFLQKFPNSDYKDLAYLQEVGAYQQLNDAPHMYQAARKALEANPDSPEAVYWACISFPYAFKPTDSNASAELSQAETDAKHGLEVLQKAQKPPNVSDEQYIPQLKAARALFNNTVGFVALQGKDYAAAVTSFKAAADDTPNDFTSFYRLGLAYASSTPPDYDNAIWYMARGEALAKAAKNPFETQINQDLGRLYSGYHGSDAGLTDIIAQAATSPTPPAGFKVTPAEKHKPTGKPVVDFFYNVEDTMKAGGDQATQFWSQIKGQEFQSPGKVVSAEPGSEPGTTNVSLAITDEGKAKDTPEIILRTKQADAKYFAKGDIVTSFKGTIADNSLTPSFTMTLDGTVDQESLDDAKAKRAKAKGASKAKPHTAAHHTKTSG